MNTLLVGSLMANLGMDTSEFTAGLDKATADLQSATDKIGAKMKDVGKTMSTYVTLPLVAFGAGAIYTATSFDDSMRKVQAVTSATGAEFDTLKETAMTLGADTAFSAGEAAEAMQYLGMAGLTTAEILEATPQMLSLASAGALELGTAADIATNVLSGFNLGVSDLAHVSDILASAASSSNTSVEDLGIAMTYVAPVASAVGRSIEETTAAIEIMSNAGIQGSMAGTALRGMISALIGPSGEAAKAIESYGLSLDDVSPETHTFAEIIKTLGDAGLTTADAMTIFGDRAGPGVLALLAAGDEALTDYTVKLEDCDGAAKTMAETMEGGLGGKMRALEGSIETLMITFGDLLAVYLLPIIDVLIQAANWFSGLDEGTKILLITIGGIAAAVGPVLIVLGTLVGAISSLMPVITLVTGGAGLAGLGTTLAALAPVILPVIAVIAALAAAAYLIYTNWDTISGYLTPIWENLLAVGTTVFEILKILFLNFTPIGQIIENWDTIHAGLVSVWEALKAVAEPVFGALTYLFMNFTPVGLIISHWDTIKEALGKAWAFISDNALTFLKGFSAIMETGWNGIACGIEVVGNGIVSFIYKTMNAMLTKVESSINNVIDKINDVIKASNKYLGTHFDLMPKIHLSFDETNIPSFVVPKWKDTVYGKVVDAVTGLLTSAPIEIEDAVSVAVDDVSAKVTNPPVQTTPAPTVAPTVSLSDATTIEALTAQLEAATIAGETQETAQISGAVAISEWQAGALGANVLSMPSIVFPDILNVAVVEFTAALPALTLATDEPAEKDDGPEDIDIDAEFDIAEIPEFELPEFQPVEPPEQVGTVGILTQILNQLVSLGMQETRVIVEIDGNAIGESMYKTWSRKTGGV